METRKMNKTASPLRRLAGFAVAACAGFAFAGPAPAAAEFSITGFTADALDADGNVEIQAGTPPHIVENVIEIAHDPGPPRIPDGNVKDVIVDLPAGFVGNPQNVPMCRQQDLAGDGCPPSTQVGVMTLSTFAQLRAPVYNMEPPPGVPAQFAFELVSVRVFINASVRPDDHGLRMTIRNISAGLPVFGTHLELWGVPADPAHDADRGGPSHAPMTAFLWNSGDCASGPPVTRVRANSWQEPDVWSEAEFVGEPLTGCEELEFDPQIDVDPASAAADTPSGYRVELTATQNDSATGRATASLKRAVVAFPEGTAVNPSAADGLEACTEAQIGLGTDSPVQCPDAAKIGKVTLDSPLQSEPMTGGIYLAEQDANPFGSTLAIYLAPEGGGVQLKLPGEIATDPQTGQLTTTFDDNPQLPFDSFVLEFDGGPRSTLVNPPTCGTKTVDARFTPWSASDPDNPPPAEVVQRTDSFAITQGAEGQPCAATLESRPFDPAIAAGMDNPVAGSLSPFVMRFTRPDGHQEILSTEVTPPPGVTAVLRGVPLCADAQASAGACPAESAIGRTVIGAGAGASPFYVPGGDVYLAGPYKGAPLSLVIKVPAVAGPLDLGDVVVRAAVHLDPRTAQLRVISDPIPQILEGIPLRVRDIRVILDRPGFTVAPTNCEEMQVDAVVHGSHGATSAETDRFQVVECGSLGFAPDLKFKATGGKKATKRNGHPGLQATLTKPEGEANLSRVEVALPKGLLLDQNANALVDPCTRPEYANGQCPETSKVGEAVAHSPLLDEPLQGPVYLRTSDNPLPDLVADLEGIVDIELVGRIDQRVTGKGKNRSSRIRNTFDIVPDVPVSSFELALKGGDEGLLVNENSGKGLCGNNRRAMNVAMDAHNGMATDYRTKLASEPCDKAKAKALKAKARQLKAKAKALRQRAKHASSKAQAKQLKRKAKRLSKRADKLRKRAQRLERAL